jgi:hypothetical protein
LVDAIVAIGKGMQQCHGTNIIVIGPHVAVENDGYRLLMLAEGNIAQQQKSKAK